MKRLVSHSLKHIMRATFLTERKTNGLDTRLFKVSPAFEPIVTHQAGAYPGSCSKKRLGVFLLPLDEMLVHRRVTPSIKFASTHLHTWVERGTVKVKWPGLEPGLHASESSALTMRPPQISRKKDNLERWTKIFKTNFQKLSVSFDFELEFLEILVERNALSNYQPIVPVQEKYPDG